jgi:hypothetical protein
MRRAEYFECDDGVSTDHRMRENPTQGLLNFLLNDPAVLRAVGAFTGCGPLSCFWGRAFRYESGRHFDRWHDDMGRGRRIALALNLSEAAFRGGIFQLCDIRTGRLTVQHANTGPGRAAVFRIAPWLRHQMTPVGRGPHRAIFAGWFHSRPDPRTPPRGRMPWRQAAPRPLRAARFLAAPDAFWHALPGGTALYHARSGASFGLDAVGSRAWGLLARGVAPAGASRALSREYRVASQTLEQDLRRLAGEFLAAGLLERIPG